MCSLNSRQSTGNLSSIPATTKQAKAEIVKVENIPIIDNLLSPLRSYYIHNEQPVAYIFIMSDLYRNGVTNIVRCIFEPMMKDEADFFQIGKLTPVPVDRLDSGAPKVLDCLLIDAFAGKNARDQRHVGLDRLHRRCRHATERPYNSRSGLSKNPPGPRSQAAAFFRKPGCR